MRIFVISVIVGILILGALGNAFALNPDYLGNNIAQTGETITGRTLTGVSEPHVADNGDVIFIGAFNNGPGIFLIPFDGSSPSLLAKVGGTIDGFNLFDISNLSINDNGDVVFTSASVFNNIFPGLGIFLIPSDGSPPSLLIQVCPFCMSPSAPTVAGKTLTSADFLSINNSGDLVFRGGFSGGHGIFLIPGDDSSPSLLVETGVTIDDLTVTLFGAPSINNNDKVVFVGEFGSNFEHAIFTPTTVLAEPGDVIGGIEIPSFTEASDFVNGPSLNDNGDVVFAAFTNNGPKFFLIPGDGSLASVLLSGGDTIGGQTLTGFEKTSRNNNGDLLFIGSFNSLDSGIFTSTNLIAQTGDTINGLTLSNVDDPSMNNNGDVVFVGTGSGPGIYLASLPVVGSVECAIGTTLNVSTNVCEPDVTQAQLTAAENARDAALADLTNLFTNNSCDPPAGTIQEVLDCITNLDTDLTDAENALTTAENDRDAALADLTNLFDNNSCDPQAMDIPEVFACINTLIFDLGQTTSDLFDANARILELESADIFSINFVQPILTAVLGISDVADDASLTRTLERSLSTAERADGVACKGVVSFVEDVNTLLDDGTINAEEHIALLASAAALEQSCILS